MNLKRILLPRYRHEVKGCARIKKFTWFLALVLVLQTSGISAQAARLDLDMRNTTLLDLFTHIENNSQYRFFYSNDEVDVTQKVSVKSKDEVIGNVLNEAFDDLPYSFRELNNSLILIELGKKDQSMAADQQKMLHGTVKDLSGMPLPGVAILEKGTNNGTVTDIEGAYTISVTSEESILQFSFVGMKTQEVVVGQQTDIYVVMVEDAIQLDEVVAIGYGVLRKADLTSSISAIDAEELENLPVPGVEQALQGRATGVTVTSSSGLPGAAVSVRIRGIGSVNTNDPLYVVDGIPTQDINSLNPSDIESLQVLKDASAAAIYGSRAASGVILISTKQGSMGKPVITFDAYTGTSKPWKDYEPAGRDEYLYMSRQVNGESSPEYATALAEYNQGYNTNWWKETVKTGSINNYNLNVNGGNEKMRYNLSGGYMDQKGMIKPSGYQRLSARINTVYKYSERIEFGENLAISNETKENTEYTLLQVIQLYDPLVPAIDPERDQSDPFSKFGNSDIMFGSNPLARLARTVGDEKTLRMLGNVYASVTFWDQLIFKTNVGIDLRRRDSYSFSPTYFFDASDLNSLASTRADNRSTNGWVWSNTLTWDQTFGSHHINVLAGTQAENTESRWVIGTKYGQIGNEQRYRYLDAGTEGDLAQGSTEGLSLNSYFGRLNYSYGDKYLLSGSIRRDGSSNFAEGYRWGTFPSISLGWVISNENFWGNIGANWFSNLKVRGGWGQLGNQNIPSGAYTSYVEGSVYRRYVLNAEDIMQGYAISNTGNSSIQWETVEQSNIGVEMGFLRNAIRVEADFFNRQTKDMLIAYPIASTFGASSPWVNAGSVENKGFEISVSYKGNVGDLTYNIGGNMSTYKNKVTDLGQGQPYLESIPGARVTGTSRTEVGRPIGEFVGWKTDGIFQSETEINNYAKDGQLIQPNARPGDFKFVDIDDDGQITDNDKTAIGSPHPKFTYGGNIDLMYKGFDLSLFLQGSYGNKLFNINKYYTHRPLGFDNVEAGAAYDAWTPENGSNEYPIMSVNDPNNNYRSSDWYVEDGSYLRIKNIQLGYTLPDNVLSTLHVTNIRVYVASQNLYTFTKYSGLDPEIGPYNVTNEGQQQRSMGVDYHTFPQSRTLQLGISLKF